MKPGRKGLARLWYATLYSWSGIRAAFQNEAAFRQEVMLVLLMTPVSFLIATTLFEWLLLIMPLLLLLIIELLNSAIESVGRHLHA
jgi:diacylglycerol kinase (ATP)